MPGESVEHLACVVCGHRVYTAKGRATALPAVSEKRRYRPRKPKYGERPPTDTRAPWGSSGTSRTRRYERLLEPPASIAPDRPLTQTGAL